MTNLLLDQARLAGTSLVGLMRMELRRAVEEELKVLRDEQVKHLDARLQDFQKKILANTRFQESVHADGSHSVAVQFVIPLDQLRKECGL